MATGVGRGIMQLSAFDGPSPKTSYRRKNLAKISCASRVIANFVPNFVAMTTGVGGGKMQLAAFDGPSPKTSYRHKNLAKISCANRVIAYFGPNFVAIATVVGRGKCNWRHSMAHPRKPFLGAKISQKSLTQAELLPILSKILFPWQRRSVGGKCDWQHLMAHLRNPSPL